MTDFSKVLVISLHSAFQTVLVFDELRYGGVNRAKATHHGLGGKGTNVVQVLAQLGIPSQLLTLLPESDEEKFSTMLGSDLITLHALRCQGSLRTCQTLINQGNGEVTEIIQSSKLSGYTLDELLERLSTGLEDSPAVLVTGSMPPGLPGEYLQRMFEKIKARASLFMVDLVGEPFALAQPFCPDIVKINHKEWGINQLGDPQSFRPPWGRWVLTQGAQELLWFTPRAKGALPIEVIHPAYPIGAGDALAAGLIYALYMQKPWEVALGIAVNTASKSCQKLMPGEI
jgi:1-phosphofructokinase